MLSKFAPLVRAIRSRPRSKVDPSTAPTFDVPGAPGAPGARTVPSAIIAPATPAAPAASDAPYTLPSVPLDVACHGDAMCTRCTALELTPQRFVVLPGDEDAGISNRPDGDMVDLGPIEAMAQRTSCPMCRLVFVAVGGDRIPTHESGKPVHVSFSWNTEGPRVPEQPWVHKAAVRVLHLSVLTADGNFVRAKTLFFPEVTLLQDDLLAAAGGAGGRAVPEAGDHLVRLRRPDAIDFSLVRRWIGLCNTNHSDACRTNPLLRLNTLQREHQHPADEVPEFRCIDVARGCLARVSCDQPYAALSYVWGRRKFYCTKRAAVAELEQPGSLAKLGDHLPLTIRDALHAAHEVGLAYLWIDTLCIVQDDDEVKMQTILKMDLVYCAAELVIVAAGSPDAYAGIAGVHPGTRGRRQAVEELAPGFRLAVNARWQDYIDDVSYYTRGWTLQESHFATRSLVFIGGTVVFRCQAADAWQEHVPEPQDEVRGIKSMDDDLEQNNNDVGTMEQFLNDYSARVLSFGDDLYHAFSGIARQLTVQYNTDLCHGLPTRFFDWHLLWDPATRAHPQRCGGGDPRNSNVRGPSWSWSGWTEGVWAHMWDWHTRDIHHVSRSIRQHTWIVWYQRIAHDSTECIPLVRHPQQGGDNANDSDDDDNGDDNGKASGNRTRNLYGAPTKTKRRFPGLDCTRTEPSDVVLVAETEDDAAPPPALPPRYVKDTLSENPGSGFLQFWTVSLVLRISESVVDNGGGDDGGDDDGGGPGGLGGFLPFPSGPPDDRRRLSLVGRSGTEVGSVLVQPDWLEKQQPGMPQEREFIVLCEARDERAPNNGDPDKHKAGWRFKVMLLEWVTAAGQRQAIRSISSTDAEAGADAEADDAPGPVYAERVAIGSIGLGDLGEALGDGAVWKEIILG